MPNVSVINGQPTGSSFNYGGTTFYQWNFTVDVNGQIYIVTEYFDTNDSADEPGLAEDVIEDIENGDVDLGGIAEGDGTGDSPGNDDGDDDGDGAVASGDGSDYGDSA
jgi:hypothetical protein